MLHTLVTEQMKRRKPLYVWLVHLTKAFDYIHRNALYFKLKNAVESLYEPLYPCSIRLSVESSVTTI